MSEISPELSAALETEYGPVCAEFTINQVPEGGAPEEIREQWLGVSLPVRESHITLGSMSTARYVDFLTTTEKINKFPIRVIGLEAVDALVIANKHGAADFWRQFELGVFVFRGYEGQLKSTE